MVAAVLVATPLVLTAAASQAGSVYQTAIVVDGAWETRVGPDGSYYIAGQAPVGGMTSTPGAYSEPHSNGLGAFVSRYDPTGHLVWQVTLGGNARAGADALAVGQDGSVYVSGTVGFPTAFPTTPGALSRDYDPGDETNFAAKLSADGSELEYGTILPGVFSATDMEVDDAGHAVLTGGAYPDLPTTPGAFQTADPVDPAVGMPAYVAELSADGSRYHWASYFGGPNTTLPDQVEIGPGDEVVVGGKALGNDFPTTSGTVSTVVHGYGDAFVAVLSSNGQNLLAGTTIGGTETDDERPSGMAVHGDSVWLAGSTNATDFPTTANAWFPAKPAGFRTTAWVAKLPLSLDSFDFSTYLPAHGAGEIHPAPGGDAVVEVGGNPSPDFPRPGDDIGHGAGFLYLDPGGALDDATIVSGSPFDFDVDRAGSIYTATWSSLSVRAVTRGTRRRATLGRDARCTINGTGGPDVLHGRPGPDVICGRGGDDVLIGNDSYDVLRGGRGSDVLRGGRGIDVLVGGPGNDVLAGNARRDLIVGGGGADRLIGDTGADLLRGGKGRDLLDGGNGHDHCGDPQRSTRYRHCENHR